MSRAGQYGAARMTDSTQASGFNFPLHYSQYVSASAPTGGQIRFEGKTPQPGFMELLAEVCPCVGKKRPRSRGQQIEQEWLAQRRRQSVTTRPSPFDEFQRRFSSASGSPRRSVTVARPPALADITEQTEPNTRINSLAETPAAVDVETVWATAGPSRVDRATAARERSRRNSAHVIPPRGRTFRKGKETRLSNVEEQSETSSTPSRRSSTDGATVSTFEAGPTETGTPNDAEIRTGRKHRRKRSRSSLSHKARKSVKIYAEKGRAATHAPRKESIALIEGFWSRFRPLFKKKSNPKRNEPMMEMKTIVSRPQSPTTLEVTHNTMSGAISSSSASSSTSYAPSTNPAESRADSDDKTGKVILSRTTTMTTDVAPPEVDAAQEGETRSMKSVTFSLPPDDDLTASQSTAGR